MKPSTDLRVQNATKMEHNNWYYFLRHKESEQTEKKKFAKVTLVGRVQSWEVVIQKFA